MKRYRSNLIAPDLEPFFIHAKEAPWRNPQGHVTLYDPEIFDTCGYISHDEAAILYNLAYLNPGPWLEIGSHTGWSGSHIAKGIAPHDCLDAVEPEWVHPQYNKTLDPAFFYKRANDNFFRAGVKNEITKWPMNSQTFFDFVPLKNRYRGVFIDGEHEPPFPLRDTEAVYPFLAEDALVIYHDVLGKPVQEGMKYLIDKGFEHHIYWTPQLMGVCWRGNIQIPDHDNDLDFDWITWMDTMDWVEGVR